MLRITAIAAGVLALAACSPSNSTPVVPDDENLVVNQPTEPEAEDGSPLRESPAPINATALMPYTADNYPDTVAKYGSTISKMEQERKTAAEITAMDVRCDEVMTVEITTRSSSNNRRYIARLQEQNSHVLRC